MKEKNYFLTIDALKGLAILGVVAIHSGMNHQTGILSVIGEMGANGVQLFFIISAFLACCSLEKTPISSPHDWFIWMKKKILNIAPLYFFWMIIALIETEGVGNPYWGGNNPISVKNILSHILFLNAFHPYFINSIMSVEWYIADLMLFYAVCPLLMIFIRKSIIRASALTIFMVYFSAIFSHGLGWIIHSSSNPVVNTWVFNFGFFNQLQVMVFGILLYTIWPYVSKIKKAMGYGFIAVASYFLLLVMFNRELNVISIFAILAMGFILLIVGVEATNCIIINNIFFQTIGRYSFGIYLTHYTLIDYLYKKGWLENGCSLEDYAIKYLLILIICLILAIISKKVDCTLRKIIKRSNI